MPFYNYVCNNCNFQTEVRQNIMDLPLTLCTKCKQESMRRAILSSPAISFKGQGFYINDSTKAKEKPKSKRIEPVQSSD